MASDTGSFNFQSPAGITGIKSNIAAIDKSAFLRKKKIFNRRIEAIDFIEFELVDQIEALLQKANQPDELILLKHEAEKAKHWLEEINDKIFQEVRKKIQVKKYKEKYFRWMIGEYLDFNFGGSEFRHEAGYDNLDIFMNGLFSYGAMPEQTKDLDPEMVFYQKTPARVVFELVEKAHFTKDDVFFDLGSGLGQVVILVNLLSGIAACGVEFEPAFCNYARGCATQLNLSGVTFINEDARKAEYSKGTVFFMFTPFEGEMLQAVLEILRKEAQSRRIRIFTYGPCTPVVALQDWLDFSGSDASNIYAPAVFDSH